MSVTKMTSRDNLADLMKELKGMSGSEKLKKAAAAKLAYKESMEAMRGGKAEHDATLLKPNRQYAGVKVHSPVSEGDVKRLVGDNFYSIDFEHEGKTYLLYASHNSGKKNKLAKRLFERTMMGKVLIIGAHQNVVKKWTFVKLDKEASPTALESSIDSSSSSSSSSSPPDQLSALWAKIAESEGSNLSHFLQPSSVAVPPSVLPSDSFSEVISDSSPSTLDTSSDVTCLHHCDGDTCKVDFTLFSEASAETVPETTKENGENDDEGENLHLEIDTSNILKDSA
jgi:hypothetical protein